jgi:signal transduction histidine kinase
VSRLLGLRGRITAALLGVSALTLAIAGVSLLIPLDRQLRDDALGSLEQTAQTAKPTFDDLPASAIQPQAPELAAAARDLKRRTAAEVAVVDQAGRILAATDLDRGERFPDVARAVRDQRVVSAIADGSEGSEAQVAVPLEADGRRFGLALRKSLEDLSAAQAVVRRALLIAGLIALVTAALAGIALATRLVRRLTALRDTTLRVAELGPIAEVQADDTHDEIGDLTRSFATMQKRLREQEQARRTFVSTASHELRTPLAALHLMLHSASEELDEPHPDLHDARDQLARALGQTERLSKLAAELLDLSRLDAGLALRSELVECAELARSVIAEFEPRALRMGARIELSTHGNAWSVTDPGSAAQILRILLDNAIRHSPPGVPVAVDVAMGEEDLLISVRDQGPGVSADDRERIFERFQRGTGAGQDGGFGLGLAIGRELARRVGGDLRLQSTEDRGAHFELALPAAPGEPSETP